ncbi:hypothetical protein DN068_12110 [Taibaiella soli]|uniref:Uncharacterized protein n=2 Tax=Taibaiella soli TaxID=1649169 RepID=A0A2W2BXL9_9BACT|nr:hypothetical protein DN068_12110 [Taibaiella soli]
MAQEKDCFPNCNISWEMVRNERNPLWTRVNISDECRKRIDKKRQEYIDDDKSNWKYLHKVACSYQSGWVENNEGECQAGGPPPCCPVQHWHQETGSWEKFLEICRRVKYARQAELEKIYNECHNAERTPVINSFNNEYDAAVACWRFLKSENAPGNALNDFVTRLNSLHQNFAAAVASDQTAPSLKQGLDLLLVLKDQICDYQIPPQSSKTPVPPKNQSKTGHGSTEHAGNYYELQIDPDGFEKTIKHSPFAKPNDSNSHSKFWDEPSTVKNNSSGMRNNSTNPQSTVSTNLATELKTSSQEMGELLQNKEQNISYQIAIGLQQQASIATTTYEQNTLNIAAGTAVIASGIEDMIRRRQAEKAAAAEQIRQQTEQQELEQRTVNERKAFMNAIPGFSVPSPFSNFKDSTIYIYALGWDEISFSNFTVAVSEPLAVKQLSDGTWPLVSNLTEHYGKQLHFKTVKFLGYFEQTTICEAQQAEIVDQLKELGATIRILTLSVNKQNDDPTKDFWNK